MVLTPPLPPPYIGYDLAIQSKLNQSVCVYVCVCVCV